MLGCEQADCCIYALTEIHAFVCRIDARGIMHLAVALAGLMKVRR